MTTERADEAEVVRAEASGAAAKHVGALRADPAKVAKARADIDETGYAIVEGLLSADEVAALREEMERLLARTGRNPFEGFRTQRVYGLLARTLSLNPLIEHPLVLDLLDGLFLPNYLLSQVVAINILPGEDAQALHHDDVLYPIPRPRPAVSVATMWSLCDFTVENGGTRLIPGSHRWGDRGPTAEDEVIAAQMPAGSMLFYVGTLWHGGGPNVSGAPRLGVTVQYCEPWCRTVENFGMSTPPETAARCSEAVRSMLGYSVHGHLMGYVDGRHPKRRLPSA